MAHETYIKEVAGSKTAVLFIHGFLGSPEHFERFIPKLSDSVSVFNILLTGHGGTVLDFGKASMDIWKQQAAGEAERICEKYENVYIVAHSMGTFFAMEAANAHPDKVKGIILLQTPLKIGVKPSAAINTFKSFFNIFDEDDTSRAYKAAHSVTLNFKVWEYASWIPRYIELFREAKCARNTICALRVPCLIFQAKKDELVSMKSVKYIPQKESIKLTVLENSAHFIYDQDDEKAMADAILNMVK
ncbi:MAG: alpha/beta fold hydrolase [Ruminococcaceae bacterium]|nr:alpha/beta fold hydrolase [Oscillospiraceae bacterium]